MQKIITPEIVTHPLGAYADANDPAETQTELTIPESFADLTDTEVQELNDRAVEAFQALYKGGENLSDEDLDQLAGLTEGIEAIQAERETRLAASQERAQRAAELAAKVQAEKTPTDDEKAPEKDAEGSEETSDDEKKPADGEDDEDTKNRDEDDDESAAQTVTASAQRRRRTFAVPAARASRHLPKRQTQTQGMRDVAFASSDVAGFTAGQGVDWLDAGSIVNSRLMGFNESAYASASRAGRSLSSRQGVFSVSKNIPEELTIADRTGSAVEEVLNRATSERRLKGGSLVASGGWCAPSETLYDLLELESRDGLFDLPEVAIKRGGIVRTLGPNFADIYNSIEAFHYTEEQDSKGDYDGKGGGSKPCVKVGCPDFEEFRLDVVGLCIQAGLLQQKGYPEVIARTLRGALVAHDHRMANMSLTAIEKGSKSVTMPKQDGVTAPLLEAIELQVEHLRYSQRISRSTTIEAIFPFWVRGAIRTDLSKRNGVDLLSVTDQQINGWFTARGIRAQFVYNWQDVNSLESAAFTGWPNQVKFIMYPAGTWIRGASDIISVDTMFDSQTLGTNDYTALFTEEGWMVVKMGHDSRVVTVPLDASGATASQKALSDSPVTIPASPAQAFAEPTTPSIIEAPASAAPAGNV